MSATGLREQKKQQTRQAISDSATRLFIERGFDQVTIADVAADARVAKMTVTNYFPRKEDLALDAHDEFVADLAHTVRARAAGESALAALRRSYLDAVERRLPMIGFSGPEFAKMIMDSPALLSRLREFHDDREETLAAALAEETHAAPEDPTPRVAAALLNGVHRVLFADVLHRTGAAQSNDEIAAANTATAHTAFTLLEPALADYAKT